MQFTRLIGPVKEMEAWNANRNGFSFVISHESPGGSGFRGRTGFAASWRPIDQNSSAIEILGSPFSTLAGAENACKAMASLLMKSGPGRRVAGDEAGGRDARASRAGRLQGAAGPRFTPFAMALDIRLRQFRRQNGCPGG